MEKKEQGTFSDKSSGSKGGSMEQRRKHNDLTTGGITDTLVRLTLPILGTSLIMMLHNLIDMWCVSQLGSTEVAAAGTGGFYIWLSMALSSISRVGSQVKVAHGMGEKQYREAAKYIQSGLCLTLIMGILFGLCLITQRQALIDFYGFTDPEVVELGVIYVATIGFAMPFFFLNPVFAAVYQALGNSRLPFWVNAVGLSGNIVLNFALIFGLGPFPALGVFGAALATSIAQLFMSLLFILMILTSKEEVFLQIRWIKDIERTKIKEIAKIGFPFGMQDALFSLISIVMARLVAGFGNMETAAYRVGSNIEALSWETGVGFSTALTSFVGQNYSAGKRQRVLKAYRNTVVLSCSIGLFAFVLFFFFAEEIFTLFFPGEPQTVAAGTLYLTVVSYSQIFMCLEITTSGLFSGMGKTHIPSIVGIVFTALRIPTAYFLSQPQYLGIAGVWWVISLSSVCKGSVLLLIYFYHRAFRADVFSKPLISG